MLPWLLPTLVSTALAGSPVSGEVSVLGDADVAGLAVRLVGDGSEVGAFTDEEGRFELSDVEDGPYMLIVTGAGVYSAVLDVVVDGPLDPIEVTVEAADDVEQEFVVIGQRTPPEITERVLDIKDIQVLPGTNGDAVRAVQNLPGIGRPPLNIGQLLIRGTAPEDSAYYIDGARIPLVFHFAGFSTVINSDSLVEVAFLPGNYGVRYGRTQGGVVDLRTNRQLPDESRGYVSVDLFQATAFVEQRLSPKTSLSISGRRSWVDAVLNPVLKGATGGGIQAPRYYDLQTRLLHKSSALGTFDAFLVVSDDRFRFVGPTEEGEEEETQIGLSTNFQKLRLAHSVGIGRWRAETSMIGGPEVQSFALAPNGNAYERRTQFGVRHEWTNESSGYVTWRLGADAQVTRFDFLYDVPSISTKEEGVVWTVAPAFYVEPTLEVEWVKIIPGLRVDSFWQDSGYTAMPVDPRLAVVYNDGGATSVKTSVGRYSQFPLERQVLDNGEGNPELSPSWSLQTSVGVVQKLGPDASIELTRFDSMLRNQVVGREDAFRFYTGPPEFGPLDTGAYSNEGTGYVQGFEALFKYNDEKTTAWVAGTFSRSTRTKRYGTERELFRYDQPIVLTAVGSRTFPKNWRLGARVRFGSGNPYTEVANRFADLDSRQFVPVFGPIDEARLPAFFSLDMRVDKTWEFRKWDLSLYVDLQNATNRANPEVMAWSYDYEQEEPITSIPVLPAFGLKGAW